MIQSLLFTKTESQFIPSINDELALIQDIEKMHIYLLEFYKKAQLIENEIKILHDLSDLYYKITAIYCSNRWIYFYKHYPYIINTYPILADEYIWEQLHRFISIKQELLSVLQ
ncbi:MAG: hypothetical protein KGV48_000185 [Alcaligenaceae bacterium]|nr:hypothetical protein [Alcaligenaceae bacterium]